MAVQKENPNIELYHQSYWNGIYPRRWVLILRMILLRLFFNPSIFLESEDNEILEISMDTLFIFKLTRFQVLPDISLK